MESLRRLFRMPSVMELAQRELEQAQRELLVAQSTAEYATRMADYNADRIRRLKEVLLDGAAI